MMAKKGRPEETRIQITSQAGKKKREKKRKHEHHLNVRDPTGKEHCNVCKTRKKEIKATQSALKHLKR